MTPCVYLMSCGSCREIETSRFIPGSYIVLNSGLNQYRHTAQLTGNFEIGARQRCLVHLKL